ncbi:MAG: AraC family transcriptional regulator [Lachnospirales bacterium]
MSTKNIHINFKTLVEPNETQNIHYHNGYELIFITEGTSNFLINNKNIVAGEGSMLFINNLEKHKMCPKTLPYSRYMIIIDSDFLDSFVKENSLLTIFKIRRESFIPSFNIDEKNMAKIVSYLEELLKIATEKKEFWEIEFMHIFSSLLIFLYREYKNKFPLTHCGNYDQILKIQSYIDMNFQKDIALNDIATEFFINKYYLSHTFKEIVGFSLKQYILLKRISFAKNLLYYSDKSITSIAFESGFNSQSNFIKLFKKKEAITPLQFRKKYSKQEQNNVK